MSPHLPLQDLVLTYTVALVFIVALGRLHVPSVVALIVAGAVAGPSGLGLVGTQQEVYAIAEIGIVLLLFTVGLDFSFVEVARVWKRVAIGGAAQIAVTAAALAIVLLLTTGVSASAALLLGLCVALSSTAIGLKELSRRDELSTPHGRLMLGVLLLQDLGVVVFLLLVPILSGQVPLSDAPVALGRALLTLAGVAILGRLVLPRFLRLVGQTAGRDAFALAIVVCSVGTAWVSARLGVSMAIGAFLAGLVLAESEFSDQALAEIRPLRDVLASLFFLSLGLLLDLGAVVSEIGLVLLGIGAIVIAKWAIATGALRLAGSPLRVALAAGLGLAQIGEFAFILGRAGVDAEILGDRSWQLLLSTGIGSMMITPLLVGRAPDVAAWLTRRHQRTAPTEVAAVPAPPGHVLVLGFGLGGQLIGKALRASGVPYLIMELNGATVQSARAAGEDVVYGDATNPESLRAAGAAQARGVVIVLSDPDASARAVRAIRRMNATAPLVVRTRYRLQAQRMERLGATAAVAEEVEASLEALAQLLTHLGIAGNLVEARLTELRHESTGSARAPRAPAQPLDSLSGDIGHMPVATHALGERDWAVGRTLAELNLRASTGVSVLALRRGREQISNPDPQETLRDGDTLYLVGSPACIDAARQQLTQGESS